MILVLVNHGAWIAATALLLLASAGGVETFHVVQKNLSLLLAFCALTLFIVGMQIAWVPG